MARPGSVLIQPRARLIQHKSRWLGPRVAPILWGKRTERVAKKLKQKMPGLVHNRICWGLVESTADPSLI